MSKKELLLQAYENVKEKELDCITLYIHMPTGETEVIVNPRVAEKIEYIQKTYNDDLVHNNCDKIYVEDYLFCEKTQGLTFGFALEELKDGKKVSRKGWNGKKQYIELATNVSYMNPDGKVENVNHSDMGNKAIAFVGTSGIQLGWLASQADMLSEDWQVVE